MRTHQFKNGMKSLKECTGREASFKELEEISENRRVRLLRAERDQLQEEVVELRAIFDLQQTRMKQATRLWQKAHNKPNVLPDLGDLLTWLCENMNQSES